MSDRFAALLLDMDGTIVDSEPRHIRAHRLLLERKGVHATEAEIVGNIGKGDADFYRELALRAGCTGPIAGWLAEKEDILVAIYRQEGLPQRPGLAELLAHAQAEGICCCVVTNSQRDSAVEALAAAGLAARLPIRICHEDVRRHKPAPDPYLLAASRLGVPIERCLAIEDSEPGVRSACAAGATVIGFAGLVSAERLRAAGACRCIAALNEILPLEAVPMAPGGRAMRSAGAR